MNNLIPVKSFLSKLIDPPVEELGLLLQDNVRIWRLKNQLKVLERTKKICEERGITTRMVSLKTMCPLLDFASLEENEVLQEKWSNLLLNLIDSTKNFTSNVYPHILNQISIDEFNLLEETLNEHNEELFNMITQRERLEYLLYELHSRHKEIDHIVTEYEKNIIDQEYYKSIIKERSKIYSNLNEVKKELHHLDYNINSNKVMLKNYLPDIEMQNLIRLGLIKVEIISVGYLEKISIPNNTEREYVDIYDLPVSVDNVDENFIMTDLGKKFILACRI